MLIAGDIGGTKSNLIAYEERGASLSVVARKRYATRDFASFEALVEEFSREAGRSAAHIENKDLDRRLSDLCGECQVADHPTLEPQPRLADGVVEIAVERHRAVFRPHQSEGLQRCGEAPPGRPRQHFEIGDGVVEDGHGAGPVATGVSPGKPHSDHEPS